MPDTSLISLGISCLSDTKSIRKTIKDMMINAVVDKALSQVEIDLREDNYRSKDLEGFDLVIYDMIKKKYPKALSDSDYQNIMERYVQKRKILLPGTYSIKLKKSTFLEISKTENLKERTNHYVIRVIGNNKEDTLKEVLSDIQKAIKKVQESELVIYRNEGMKREKNARTIDNIFLKNKDEIVQYVNYWMESEDIYKKIFIPFKTGMIFYGPPGTGKTSFACALGNYLGFNVYFLSPSEIINLDYYFPRGGEENKNGIILIIDEIDNWIDEKHMVNPGRGGQAYEQTLSLKIMREYIDNMPDKTILIATTNHMEKLDASLLRAGRFDRHFQFNNIDQKTAEEMVTYHGLDKKILNCFEDRNNINPAELEKLIIQLRLQAR